MIIHMDIHIWVPRDPLGGIPWGGIPWGDRWDLGTDGTLGPMGPGPQGPWASRTPDHKTAYRLYYEVVYRYPARPGPAHGGPSDPHGSPVNWPYKGVNRPFKRITRA